MPKMTYHVTINGVKHTRSSARKYTHCVAVLRHQEAARQRAYTWTPADQKLAEENWQFECARADGSWWITNGFPFTEERDGKAKRESQAIVASGKDAFIGSQIREKTEHHERDVARGVFEWQVVGWCGSPKLAESQKRTMENHVSKSVYMAGAKVVVLENGANVTLPGQEP